ncbi:hypothetical protein GCM10027053_29350 [Intrasporangium mesophilum]
MAMPEAGTTRRALVAATVGAAVSMSVVTLRWSYLRWGAIDHETVEQLPGDELIPSPGLVATRAITIEAPPAQVWPWVAQLGQGRGGFYSYDWLENLAGCQITSADQVVPEWQDVAPGDEFRLHPKVALTVVQVDPERALVVDGRPPEGAPGPPYGFTWSFVLRKHPHLATRLIVRERYDYTQPWSPLVVEPLAFGSAVMTHKMLRGIRDRVEGLV